MTVWCGRPWLLAVAIFCFAFFVTDAGAADDLPATTRYLVRFAEPALIAYARSSGAAETIPQKRSENGRVRLEVHSEQARNYVDYLRTRQDQHLADIAASVGRAPVSLHGLQHALNAAIVVLTPDEATRIANLPGIEAVTPSSSWNSPPTSVRDSPARRQSGGARARTRIRCSPTASMTTAAISATTS